MKQLKALALATGLLFAPVAMSTDLVDVLIHANAEGGAYEGEFDSLITAVVEADLVDALKAHTPDGLTVFAPLDEAFEALGLTPKVIELIPAPLLEAILLYHVAPVAIFSEDLERFQLVKMLNDQRTVVRVKKDGAFINRAEITDFDIEASNGVIHVIDRVLRPLFLR